MRRARVAGEETTMIERMQVQGSAAVPYDVTIDRATGAATCSCPAWRNLSDKVAKAFRRPAVQAHAGGRRRAAARRGLPGPADRRAGDAAGGDEADARVGDDGRRRAREFLRRRLDLRAEVRRRPDRDRGASRARGPRDVAARQRPRPAGGRRGRVRGAARRDLRRGGHGVAEDDRRRAGRQARRPLRRARGARPGDDRTAVDGAARGARARLRARRQGAAGSDGARAVGGRARRRRRRSTR